MTASELEELVADLRGLGIHVPMTVKARWQRALVSAENALDKAREAKGEADD